ncbi:MAG: chemotaxis protein methyltransferase CheR [Candidatus Endobugula sp.]
MVDGLKNIPEDCLDFKAFCDYLQKSSGITITPSKSYLVSARIRNIMLDYKLNDLYQLIAELNRNNKLLHQKIIDAMTTNETFWFRDEYPFTYFTKKLLPYWSSKEHQDASVRIWSAACSSGQEPYSLGMLCEEYKARSSFNKKVEILATDLSSDILDKAKSGDFDRLSIVRGLSEQRLKSFFTVSSDTHWNVKPVVKRYIQFQPINLLESYASLGKFDIIFCRNVLIYFTKETKTDILQRMHKCLKPNGLLCLGSSESLAGAGGLFSMVHCNPGIIYQAK